MLSIISSGEKASQKDRRSIVAAISVCAVFGCIDARVWSAQGSRGSVPKLGCGGNF